MKVTEWVRPNPLPSSAHYTKCLENSNLEDDVSVQDTKGTIEGSLRELAGGSEGER